MQPPLILLYHGLSPLSRKLDPHNLMVKPDRFCRQIELLLRRGYSFVTVSEFLRRMDGGIPPLRTCALTFDDGGVDNAVVLPGLLERLGVPATLYVCPGLLGRPHHSVSPETGFRLMDEDELGSVATHTLIEIGSHTSTHTDLSSATFEEAYREMSESKTALEEMIQKPVLSFAYPKCGYSPECPEAAERAGYLAAATCGQRGSWQPYELRRQAVDALDRGLTFELKSRGLYDALWSSPPGRLARRVAKPIRHRR